MKKKKLFLGAIFIIAMVFLFVGCSNDVEPSVNKVGKIAIGGNASKAISTVVTYSSEVEDLYWYYSATKKDDGYKTGETTGFVAVSDSESEGLSGKILNSAGFSYGLWDIELKGFTSETKGTEGFTADTANGEYTAKIEKFLVNADMNYATADIKVGDNATTTIEFGDIWFAADNFKADSSFSLTVKDNDTTIISSVSNTATPVSGQTDKYEVRFSNLIYGDNSVSEGEHTMEFVLTQTLSGTGNTTIEAALYTLKFYVLKGTKTTISGNMVKNDQTGDIQMNGVQSVEPITISKIIPVDSGATKDSATVRTATKITVGDLEVTYPVGAVIVPGEGGLAGDGNTSDGTTGFVYRGNTLSEASGSVSVSSSESVAQYELTLNVSQENSTAYVIVEKVIEKDLVITKVLHSGIELTRTSNAPVSVTPSTEYYSYNESNGKLTLYVFHASPIDVITVNRSRLPENAKIVMNLKELENAVGGMHDGDYIAFGANIEQDEVETSSGQITPTKASDAEGEVNATIDLNGYVFDGQIGGWVFTDTNGFKLNIIGTDNVSARYYEHETGHHMVKPHAVNLYFNDALGTMTIKDGVFVCNNAVLANGNGNLVVDNGEFVAEDGIILSTYNKGTTVINGGKFVTKEECAMFVKLELSDRSDSYQEVIINGGTFVMEGLNCVGFVIDVTTCLNDENKYGSITINGGTFTFTEGADLVVALSYTATNSGVVKDSSLNNEDYKEIAKNSVIIKGGTFNLDPSCYVASGYKAVVNDNGTWTVKAETSSN